MSSRALLTDGEITERLAGLPGWSLEGRELCKEFRFPNYLAGIDFVNGLAQAAQAMNHHPDLFVGWRKVAVRLSTHSAGGVTLLDFELAVKAESLATRA